MGMRFRKSVGIAPGIRINLGKKSVGMSVGSHGIGASFNSKTGTRSHVSIPGTGISFSSKTRHFSKEQPNLESFEGGEDFSIDEYIEAGDLDNTGRTHLFLDENELASLSDNAFSYYSRLVILSGKTVTEDEKDIDYVESIKSELCLIRSEIERRASKKITFKEEVVQIRWFTFLNCIISAIGSALCLIDASIFIGIFCAALSLFSGALFVYGTAMKKK